MAAKYPAAIATDSDLLIAKNRAQTTLAGALNASDTSFTLASDAFAVDVAITIESEIIHILAKSGATVTNSIRGFDGTAAASHATGKLVSAYIDAIHHNQMSAEVKAIETSLGANLANVNTAIASAVAAAIAAIPVVSTVPKPADYAFTPLSPGGSLAVGLNTIILSPVPVGVNGSDVAHYLYISNGTGTAEAVLIAGGTAVAGAASGTVIVSCAYTHTGAWTISSATGGMQEGVNAIGAGGGLTVQYPVHVYATTTIPYPFSFKGQGPTPTIFAHGVAGQTINIFSAVGVAGALQNITVNVNSDPTQSTAASVTVADSTPFSAGDFVTIGGQANDFTNSYVQTAKVRLSAAGVITPYEPVLIRAMTTDAAHSVQKFVPIQFLFIEGITFDGTAASLAANARGIYFSYVANSEIKNCTFTNFVSAGLFLYFGHNVTVTNISVENSGNPSESDFMSSFVSFSNHTNIRSMHAAGFGPQWQYGVGLNVTAVTSLGALYRGMKLAGVGRSTFSNIVSGFPRDAAEGVCLALAWRTWSVDISGVQLAGATATYGALWVQDAQSVTLRGVHIAGSAGNGIQFEAPGGTVLGAVNVVVSELVTADPVVNGAPSSARNFIKWAAAHTCRASSSLATIVSPATSVWTSIPFDTNSYDSGIHSVSVNNTRFTAPVTAMYKFTATVFYAGAGGGNVRALRLWFNGATQLTYVQGAITGTYSIVLLTSNLGLSKNDYVEIQAFQDSGGPLAIMGANVFLTNITVELVQ